MYLLGTGQYVPVILISALPLECQTSYCVVMKPDCYKSSVKKLYLHVGRDYGICMFYSTGFSMI